MNSFVFLFLIVLCGTQISSSNVDRINRIAGGYPATDTQFPYMISLQEVASAANKRGHKCGGALVTLRHAVTSASCVHGDGNVVLNPTGYRVFAGAADLTNDTSPDRYRAVERFTVHPNYRTNAPYINDIAVITLASEFPSDAVAPVSLAAADSTIAQGATCASSGWGSQNATSVASTQLMHIQKTVFDTPTCRGFYSTPATGGDSINIGDTTICAIEAQSSSCQGDLGNPLVCNSVLNGILVFSRKLCQGLILPAPEVYTHVSIFRTWIDTATTAGASTFQPGMAVLGLISIIQIITAKVLQ